MRRTFRNIYPNPDKNTFMKSSSVFLIIGIIIISVGLAWVISGGVTGPAVIKTVPTQVTTTIVVEIPETTTAVTATTAPITVPATVIPPVTTTQITPTPTLASMSDIRQHFLDVAYSFTNRLERLNYDSSRPRVVIYASSASNEDVALIEKTAKDFNEASPTVKLSENVKETGTGDLSIKYLPEDGLAAINLADVAEAGPFTETLTRTELYQGGLPAAKILRGTIYINAELKDDDRRHILVKGLMYEMGLTGESTKFPDSVFYAGENTNVNLTSADRKIITMLYSQGNYNGMSLDQVERIVYIS